jgi:hypothetical protein
MAENPKLNIRKMNNPLRKTSKKIQSPLEKIRMAKIKQRHSDQVATQTTSKQSPQNLQKLRNQLQQKNSFFEKADLGGDDQKQQVIENVIKQINAQRNSSIDLSKIINPHYEKTTIRP